MSDPTSDLDAWIATYREVRRPSPRRRQAIRAAVLDAPRGHGTTRRRLTIAVALVACVVLGLLLVRMLGALVTRAESGESPSIAPWSATSGDDGARAHEGRAVRSSDDARPSVDSTMPKPAPVSPAPAPSVHDPVAVPPAAARPALAREPKTDRSRPSSPTPTGADDLESMRLLRRAERVLESDPSESLRLLERHARDYDASPLTLERQALRVLALCRLGRTREGKERQQSFLREHSSSAYAERVRRACADSAD